MCKSAVILQSAFGDSARWVMPSFLLVACGHAHELSQESTTPPNFVKGEANNIKQLDAPSIVPSDRSPYAAIGPDAFWWRTSGPL